MDSTNFKTSSLDFDQIKQDFINYLTYQSEFSDYDFTGSGLQVLLNLLAYNTHYNALYDNFALNESFLDSASKFSSVISHANTIGYVPRSASGATAKVNLTVVNDSTNAPDVLTLMAYSPFITKINGKNYTFYNTSDITAKRNGSVYNFYDVEIKEGYYLTLTQTYNGSYYETFKLNNQNVDTSTITVSVRENEDSTEEEIYTRAENILNIDNLSKVYFLKLNTDKTYQIQFGTGMLGKALTAGNVIEITYLVCHTNEPNGASVFEFNGSLPSGSTCTVTTAQRATGGAEMESSESIRLNSPRSYAAQNRCVTAEDYETLIKKEYPNIRGVKAWGGQDNNPPEYGKVFVSIIPQSGDKLTEVTKTDIIRNILTPKKGLTSTVQLVDPSYLKIQMYSTVYYDSNKTTLTKDDIESLVNKTILNYNEENLGNFDTVLRFSKLSTAIDNSDPSVTNNNSRIKLIQKLEPMFNLQTRYLLEIHNPIYQTISPSESIISSGFYCTDKPNTICYIDDDPQNNTLRLYYKNSSNEKVIIRRCGSIDYPNGTINIDDIKITALAENELLFTINPLSNDVSSKKNQFIMIDPTLLNITAIPNTTYSEFTHVSSKN